MFNVFAPSSSAQGRRAATVGILQMLFMASTCGAVLVAVCSVWMVSLGADVGRARELEPLRSARLLLEDTTDLTPLAAAPVLVSEAFALHSWSALARFLALGIGVTLVFFWLVAALLTPLLVVARRTGRAAVATDGGGWLWNQAYPLAALVAFSAPAILVVVRHVVTARHAVIFGWTVGVIVGVWTLLVIALRRPSQAGRLVRFTFVGSVGIIVLVGGAAAATLVRRHAVGQPPSRAGAPNILLISIDSLRRDHVHCYGYERDVSPTIDRLAREGVRFHTAVSPTSWTLPAHLTLLSALPPLRHGVTDDGMRMQPAAVLLSEVLWKAGYATAGFVSAPYLDAGYGYAQGFDHYDDYTVAKRSLPASHRGITSPALFRIVSTWLTEWDEDGRQRPFFIFAHMWDVHYDYTPPPPYDTMFDPGYAGTVTGDDFQDNQRVHAGMDPRDLAHVIALYDGEIRFTDSYIGKLVDRLQRFGVLDNTIVVVTADHGEEFFEHGRKGHKQTLYDESILVPLVIRYPPLVPAGAVVRSQVRLMDVAPTILSLAQVTRPPEFGDLGTAGMEGGQDLTWRLGDDAILPELVAFGHLIGDAPVPLSSVRTHAWKLIAEQKGGQRTELYDLLNDPGERVDVSAAEPAIGQELRANLARWQATFASRQPLSGTVHLGAEHEERLRALGYRK